MAVDEIGVDEPGRYRAQAPPKKSGKRPGSVSVHFLSTITSQNFEEPIRLVSQARLSHGEGRVWSNFHQALVLHTQQQSTL